MIEEAEQTDVYCQKAECSSIIYGNGYSYFILSRQATSLACIWHKIIKWSRKIRSTFVFLWWEIPRIWVCARISCNTYLVSVLPRNYWPKMLEKRATPGRVAKRLQSSNERERRCSRKIPLDLCALNSHETGAKGCTNTDPYLINNILTAI
jgi:hypothetical protein